MRNERQLARIFHAQPVRVPTVMSVNSGDRMRVIRTRRLAIVVCSDAGRCIATRRMKMKRNDKLTIKRRRVFGILGYLMVGDIPARSGNAHGNCRLRSTRILIRFLDKHTSGLIMQLDASVELRGYGSKDPDLKK